MLKDVRMLAPAVEAEIAELSARYGVPRRVAVELEGRPFSPLILEDRHGEVCMVVRRPNGKLLTAIKTFYPAGAFRLLTGGVGLREPIATALLREVAEETSLDVRVDRFLAVIEYRLALLHPHPFASFVFLLDEVGGILHPQDAGERIGSFREIAVAELPSLAEALEHAPDTFDPEIEGSWRDWGHFRAVSHRVVYDALGVAPPAE
jgi:8-oxo-dGTP pyrophosphatase MutT (NUDIX family)